ncbi:hypothetical protein WR25_26948 [Diploscapter pachys]|uniref:TIL domain-containing protein n=1 Tax=Diploscapter pachys TaxID=2018661 RepID=A0A2A2LNH1_9BILA|nr:hypothetical protein WR25_26948 [Diploscapter pachys]
MFKAALVLAIVCVVIYNIQAADLLEDYGKPKPCKKANEVWSKCHTACEPTCEVPEPPFCTENCLATCQCKKGYVRNKQGECVTLANCK